MEAQLYNISVFQGNTSSSIGFKFKNVTDHTDYLQFCRAKVARSRKDETIILTIPISLSPDKSQLILDLSVPETIAYTHKPEDLLGFKKLATTSPIKLPQKSYFWDLKISGSQIIWGAFFVVQNVT